MQHIFYHELFKEWLFNDVAKEGLKSVPKGHEDTFLCLMNFIQKRGPLNMKFEYLTDSNTYFRFIHVPTWTGRLQIYTDSGTPISELDRLEFTDFRVRPTRACRLQSKTDSGTPTSELDRLGHADFDRFGHRRQIPRKRLEPHLKLPFLFSLLQEKRKDVLDGL
ncbi:hypothetical protein FSP39_024247 [Pinctada imbricata]|uniref:Uncharacterized protein n=1 Tax=Pinctada imbricata TaxID=66713 RepID=A0AA88XX85_PINIB|nr:hypothetical protein FSP39_024247 [Pinctada imbricata]